MKDLTKGKPSRLILAFALPIFLANLLQLTYSLVDTRIVGSFLGEDALAAVGATSSLSNLIIGFLMGLSNGFAIITAQRFGAKDLRGEKIVCHVTDTRNCRCCGTDGSRSVFSAADFTLFKCTGKFKDNGGFLYCNHYCGIDCNISL